MPFIFLSALAERKDMIAGRKLGADDYLTKPIDLDLLLITVKSKLERFHAAQQSQWERLEHAVNHDGLTGLPTRKRFQELVAANAGGHGLIYIDIHQFRQVNHLLGRAGGDAVLRTIADRLTSAAGPGVAIARVGDDEFALLVPRDRLEEVADRVAQAAATPLERDGHRLELTAFLGLADAAVGDPTDLLANAETASRHARRDDAGGRAWFTAALADSAARRAALEHDLRLAVEAGEFRLAYQPKLSLADRRITGSEALIRWHSPTRGLVPPLDFIPIAERTGLIKQIGLWTLGEACRQAAGWARAGHGGIGVAINLSPRQFEMPNLVDELARIYAETGIDPTLVELEITESALARDTDQAIATIKALRALGSRVALDDFGTGYSSLSYLRQFPVDTLKIDRAFLANLPDDPSAVSIIEAILAMSHGLRLKTVAEGIELPAQEAFLKERGCTEGQGWLFDKALPPEEFVERLRRQG